LIVHLLVVIKTIKDITKLRAAYKAGRLLIGWGAFSFSKRIVQSSWYYMCRTVGGEIKGRRVGLGNISLYGSRNMTFAHIFVCECVCVCYSH